MISFPTALSGLFVVLIVSYGVIQMMDRKERLKNEINYNSRHASGQRGPRSNKKITIELENGSESSLLTRALEYYKRDPAITDEQHEEIEKALRDLNSPEVEVINYE